MSTARSAFTEAIEDHLALKKQNSSLESAMPLARYDVGDPLDRYPGGPGRAAEGTVVLTEELPEEGAPSADAYATTPEESAFSFGPSPEQAMEAATALEHSFGGQPFAPLNGLSPMLSLVEDLEDDATDATDADAAQDAPAVEAPAASAPTHGDVVRFPGGVGPREEAPAAAQQTLIAEEPVQVQTHAFDAPEAAADGFDADAQLDAPTGEQPVLVIDADAPLATSDWSEPAAPARSTRRKPRFFGLGRKKQQQDAGDSWFTDGPRDFNWD